MKMNNQINFRMSKVQTACKVYHLWNQNYQNVFFFCRNLWCSIIQKKLFLYLGVCKMTASRLSLAGSCTNISWAVKFLTKDCILKNPLEYPAAQHLNSNIVLMCESAKNQNNLTMSLWLMNFFCKYFFRLFPIISISQKFFKIFFLTQEKIGIDKKVICYHNISN